MAVPFDDALRAFLADSGAPYKGRLERMLRALSAEDADEVMMLMKESRGAPAALAAAGHRTALFIGDARSGAAMALAALGLTVTIVDRDADRLRYALARAEAYEPGSTRGVVGGDGPALPFSRDSFDLVMVEDGLPGPLTGRGFDMEEVRRVAASEVLVAADNRLGYKRSTGRRGVFRRSPLLLLREALRPSRGERALPGTRAAVRGPWEEAKAFALYPHAREFSHVVGLDAPLPELSVGPRERRNRVKVAANRAGLFRWLTPSFAVRARVASGATDRADALLAALADEIGEPAPRVERLVATRSNNVLLLTAPARRDEAGTSEWAIHVPLQPFKRRMVRAHHDWMASVAARYQGVPVPETLFAGRAAGLEVAAARRLRGLDGTELTGDPRRTARMFEDVCEALARLLDAEPTTVDDALWDSLLETRFERVLVQVTNAATRGRLEEMIRRLRGALVGKRLRLGMYHADLRPKHVKVDAEGRLVGLMDWGASEERFLPFVDLLQLVIHQRSQELGGHFGAAWKALSDPASRRPHEARALDRYVDLAGLDAATAAALLDAFPLFVAGMAERNWDYSRPHWVQRQFGL